MPPNMISAPPAAAAYPQQGQRHRAGRTWQQDWTNWALILALPVAFIGPVILVAANAPAGLVGSVFFIGVLGIPVGLVAKLARWLGKRTR
jgi:hypothetical protein